MRGGRRRYEPSAIPLYAAVAGIFVFAGWTLYRELRAPDVVLHHHSNPYPWQAIDPEHTPPSPMRQRVHNEKLANVARSSVNKPAGEPALTGSSTEIPRHW